MSRRLTRSRDAMVGGVAAGVANWIGTDPALVRIAWALLVPLTAGAALKRVLKTVVGQVRELYSAQPGLPAKESVDAVAWEKSTVAEIDQAAGFHDAYARAAYQTALALALMTMAVSDNPPRNAAEAMSRANDAVAVRVKEITARFTQT